MNVLKTMIFSFLLISGFSHAAPEIINANAVVYKTVEDITLKLHVYNPKKFDATLMHEVKEHATKFKAKTYFAGVGFAHAEDYEKPILKNEPYAINYTGLQEV